MIELLDIDEEVAMGRYWLHARFRQALAFVREGDGRMVSVVDESQAAGPAHIVVRGLDFSRARSLRVARRSVWLDREILPVKHHSAWRVQARVSGAAWLDRNLRALKRALSAQASARGVAFLLSESRDLETGSAFEKEVAGRLRSGVERLLAGDLRGAAQIHGVGFGLTPSGDDFLAGFALGLYALEAVGAGCFTAERRAIRALAATGNPFSAALLRHACEGRCLEPARSLIHALFEDSEAAVVDHARRLMAVGASSGADLATGLYIALRTRGPEASR